MRHLNWTRKIEENISSAQCKHHNGFGREITGVAAPGYHNKRVVVIRRERTDNKMDY